jgi:hypothetical protein
LPFIFSTIFKIKAKKYVLPDGIAFKKNRHAPLFGAWHNET